MAGTDKVDLPGLSPPPAVPPEPHGWSPRPDDPHGTFKLKQRTLTGALWTFPKPTIAALPGAAAGAGASIALAADLRVASPEAFIATGYVDIGLTGDYGQTYLLKQLVGAGRASELLFLGERLRAGEAHRLGIFNRVVGERRVLMQVAMALAAALADKPPHTLARIKDNLRSGEAGTFLAALDREAENIQEHLASKEGQEEFMEMRARFRKRAAEKRAAKQQQQQQQQQQ
eukprot:g3140.t1